MQISAANQSGSPARTGIFAYIAYSVVIALVSATRTFS